jgi:tripartite ATP-independent transporter DctM subunit
MAETVTPIAMTPGTSSAASPRRGLDTIDAGLAWIVEVVAAVLLAVEIVLLFAGILARYVFHHPFIWSDEVNAIAFLWLGMLGAVIALRRWEHMRMTTFFAMATPRGQAYLTATSTLLIVAFLVLLLPQALEHLQTESGVISPSLEVSLAWRASAMPVGFVLLAVTGLLRLRAVPLRTILLAALTTLAILGIFSLARPMFISLGQTNLIVFFLIGVPALVFAGMPIAFAFCIGTLGYLALGTYVPASILVARLEAGMSQLLLLAIPTFVFLGLLIEMTGMAEKMVAFLANLLGHIRGGLNYVLIVAMYLVSGISGSKAADMAAIAPALFPEMEKIGSDRGQMTALLAATGAQTETVPPSLILIAVGSVSGLSIAGLFTAGLLPAAFLGVLLCGLVWYQTQKLPKPAGKRPAGGIIGISFLFALPALLLPFVIRTAVVEGAATATEVSTIGIAYAVIMGLLIYRRWDWGRLFPMLVSTSSLSGAILLVTGAATAMAWAITQSGFSQSLASFIATVPGGVVSFMALSILLFAILGSVLEGLPAIVLFGPLMFPIARALGVNEIYYAIVAILSMSLGLFTPPFGVGFYITCAITSTDPARAMRFLWPYLAVLTFGVLVIACLPWMSTGFLK